MSLRQNLAYAAVQLLGGREKQEDEFATLDLSDAGGERLLMVVADGMGGHPGAADAAQIVVRTFCRNVKDGTGGLVVRLTPALTAANAALAAAGLENPAVKGAGCTFIAAAIENRSLSWISVGDSSLLLFRDGAIRKLNQSRTALAHQAAGGRRRILVQAVRGATLTDLDQPSEATALKPGDCIIVASDGLDCLTHATLASILRRSARKGPAVVLQNIVAAVHRIPQRLQDNTTTILYSAASPAKSLDGTNGRAVWVVISVAAIIVLSLVAIMRRLWQ